MEMYEKLAAKRRDLKISYDDLSLKTKISVRNLKRILAGETNDPGFETVRSIAYALGMKLDDLLDENAGSVEERCDLSPEALDIARKYDAISDDHARGMIRSHVDAEYEYHSTRTVTDEFLLASVISGPAAEGADKESRIG